MNGDFPHLIEKFFIYQCVLSGSKVGKKHQMDTIIHNKPV
jgi:hypothetical protein